jgi:hypothetical protein
LSSQEAFVTAQECKVLTCPRRSRLLKRLKLSGMRWSVRGATGIATLRCQEASGRWEEIWHRPRNQTSVA